MGCQRKPAKMITKDEEKVSGHNIASKTIENWQWEFGIPQTVRKVKSALTALKPQTAPCIDGMIEEYQGFVERHEVKN